MYWGKGNNKYLKNAKPCIPLPLELILGGDDLYCFVSASTYSYMEGRIDAFREHHMHRITSKGSGMPPGLALIGNPGIGELVLFHLFK